MALHGRDLALYARSKVGTPYFYGTKMEYLTEQKMASLHKSYPGTVTAAYMALARAKKQIGKYNTDCSGLISAYTGKLLGSAQLYSQAYARLPISEWEKFAPGVVLWKKGHVGVYLGGGKVAEAKGINYGVIISDIKATKWKYGLTFSWMDYVYTEAVDNVTYKAKNPYTEPKQTLRKGMKGQDVKWIQYELNEAGYKLVIDGDFGKKTLNAVKAFQRSAKLVVDGIVGKNTRKALAES